MSEDIQETPSSTPNLKTKLAQQLAAIAPEAIADGKVDVQKLKELLDGDAADESERFGLFWPGKLRAIRAAQEPTTATLKPEPELSKDWDTTKNVFIEGDNLEALKILQKHYHGQIKMIYIDPPYNTGKDFVYPDNFKEGLKTYLEWTKQVNEEGQKVKSNPETDGRYHSHWLNMMYPRLKLARSLLSGDGVAFVSIDHNEEPRLRQMADEIFGDGNFLNDFTWVVNLTGRQISGRGAARTFERVLAYAKDASQLSEFLVGINLAKSIMPDAYRGFNKELLEDSRGQYAVGDTLWNHNRIFNEVTRPNLVFSIYYNPSTGDIKSGDIGRENPGYIELPPHSNRDGVHKYHAWRWSRQKVDAEAQDLLVRELKHGNYEIYTKLRNFSSTTLKDLITNIPNGLKETIDLFGGKKMFDYPKSIDLVKLFAASTTRNDDTILDFFSGSATTAHAVMQLNAEDGGNRHHIQVQLPEPVDPDSVAGKAGFKTIAEIGRKRIDLAGEKIKRDYAEQLAKRETPLDVGYRAYSLTDTNFAKWRESSATDEATLEQRMLNLGESADDDASELALLTEVLLKQGYSLTESVRKEPVSGLDVWSVADSLVLAYMDEHVKPTLEQLRALVDREPERLIVLDDAFQGDDELKTNLVQAAKTRHVELWTA